MRQPAPPSDAQILRALVNLPPPRGFRSAHRAVDDCVTFRVPLRSVRSPAADDTKPFDEGAAVAAMFRASAPRWLLEHVQMSHACVFSDGHTGGDLVVEVYCSPAARGRE